MSPGLWRGGELGLGGLQNVGQRREARGVPKFREIDQVL